MPSEAFFKSQISNPKSQIRNLKSEISPPALPRFKLLPSNFQLRPPALQDLLDRLESTETWVGKFSCTTLRRRDSCVAERSTTKSEPQNYN